ncbi:MAG TPA: hypothetical protein VFE76_07645 [Myxococcales bacterium]|jgi:hypothetical protein|nr:hypothetical protein [Myxococcales bacterium]
MNRLMMRLLVGACLCGAACGNGTMPQTSNLPATPESGGSDPGTSNGGTGAGPGTGGDTGTTTTPAPAAATFNLRLLGDDAGLLKSVRLRVKSVEVRAGATVLASAGTMSEMELATGNNAFLLSTFQVPAGMDEVEFTVALDSASVESASGNFDVDAGCEVLKLRGKVSLLAQRNHAVVQLDLARSFVKVGTEMAFVPQLKLIF